jgi:hypothetical protein
MYRAQRIAEYALYDGDPHLIDSELDQYLRISADDIKVAVSRFLDVQNRVVLDIIPAALADGEAEVNVAASPQSAGEPKQPTAPAPQIPPSPKTEPASATPGVIREESTQAPGSAQQPADTTKQTDTGSGPLHP